MAGRGMFSKGSTSAFVVANNRPGEWKEYRVVVREDVFKVWQNGIPSGLDLAVPHALEINSATVEWFGNGSTSAFVVANNRPDEWKEYRVVVREHVFKVWQNGIPSGLDLAVPHADARGKLSLHLSEGEPCDVALRRIRIKE